MDVSGVRFGTLLKVRKYQERKAQEELSQIRNQKLQEKEALSELAEKRDGEISTSPQQGKVQAADLQISRAFIRKLTKEIQAQQKKIEEIQKQEETKTDEVVERKKAKEMIETLEDRYQTQLTKERDRKEQRLMDVLAQRTHSENSQ
ncbi:MAG TPA: flagellar export protein FliJ [Bacteroidota bacterium]|jgi:flagellar export protein FliJ|nr:flagellar export protein FliJ [Bacteroidota bacterium]